LHATLLLMGLLLLLLGENGSVILSLRTIVLLVKDLIMELGQPVVAGLA